MMGLRAVVRICLRRMLAVKLIWPTFWKCQVCNGWNALAILDRDAWNELDGSFACSIVTDGHSEMCLHGIYTLWRISVCVTEKKTDGMCVSTSLLALVSEAIEENRDCKLLFFISFMCHCFVKCQTLSRMWNLAMTDQI